MKRKVLKAIPVLDLELERYIFPQKLGLRHRAAAKRFYMTDDDMLKKALPHVDLDTVGPITVQDALTSSDMTLPLLLSRPHASSMIVRLHTDNSTLLSSI